MEQEIWMFWKVLESVSQDFAPEFGDLSQAGKVRGSDFIKRH